MINRKILLCFTSFGLAFMGIAAAYTFRPFLEGMPGWFGFSWLILFLTNFILTLLNFRNWLAILGLVSLVVTFAIWASV
jgi:hypothetical protein